MPQGKRGSASRPSASQRGYGAAHDARRRADARRVATGTARCARGAACKFAEEVDGVLVGGLIHPAAMWDLGHDDRDRTRYIGPEHSACNRGTHGRGGSRRRPAESHPGLI